MPTERNPDLFGFTTVEGREVVTASTVVRSRRMRERCFWERRIMRRLTARFAACFHDLRAPACVSGL